MQENQEGSGKEYFAIGFGSNYFHPFGDSAISLEEICSPGSVDLDTSGNPVLLVREVPVLAPAVPDLDSEDPDSNAGGGGTLGQDAMDANYNDNGNDIDNDSSKVKVQDGSAIINDTNANNNASIDAITGIASSDTNDVIVKMAETKSSNADTFTSTNNATSSVVGSSVGSGVGVGAPQDMMNTNTHLNAPKAYIFPLHPDHINLANKNKPNTKSAKKQSRNLFKFLRRKKKDKKNNNDDESNNNGIHETNRTLLSNSARSRSTNTSSTSNHTFTSARELPYASATKPAVQLAAGMTHATFVNAQRTKIYQTGTLHGIIYSQPTIQQPKIPLQCTQIACGRRHTLALFEHKVVMSWGSGYFGQLGHGLDKVYTQNPVVIDRLMSRYTGGSPVSVIAGGMQSAVIVADDLESWKKWDNGRNTSNGNAGGGGNAGNAGNAGSAKFETRVFRFGSNKHGQCAVEGGKCNAIAYPTPMLDVYHPETSKRVTFISLTLGKLHSVGLAVTGELYSWGSTASGRCGHGEHGATTTSVSGANANGSVMRSALRMRNRISLPKRIDALRNVKIVQICSGDAHNLALSRSGRVFSWGNNSSGQLGVGHSMHLMSPRLIADLEFGQVARGFAKGELSQAAEAPWGEENSNNGTGNVNGNGNGNAENGTQSVQVATSSNHLGSALAPIHYPSSPHKKATQRAGGAATVADPIPPSITSIHAAGAYSAAVSSTGDVYTWGCGEGNQLGHPMPAPSSPPLPTVETRSAMPRPETKTGLRTRDAQSFDSRLNVLIPRRIECLRQLGLKVENLVSSSNFMMAVCTRHDRNELQDGHRHGHGEDDGYFMGKTLFELQLERKEKGLDRIRLLRGSQKQDGDEE
jgi:alpha-tubulin suppressor-like RCC1 family protein